MSTRRVIRLEPHDEKRERMTQNGILELSGEIDADVLYSFVVNTFDAVLSGVFKDKPMLLILNSPGGSVDQGLAIHDAITAVVDAGVEVNILGLGLVASMGTVIMQAGTRRLSAPNTQFLVHQASQSIGFFGSEDVNQSKDRHDELDRLNDIVMTIVAKRSGIDVKELKERCHKKDYWMDPVNARKLGANGLIDEVTLAPLSAVLKEPYLKKP